MGKSEWKRKMDARFDTGSLGFNDFGPDRLRRKKGGTGEQFYGRFRPGVSAHGICGGGRKLHRL